MPLTDWRQTASVDQVNEELSEGAHWVREAIALLDADANRSADTLAMDFSLLPLYGPDGLVLPMRLALPGTVNRGNAAQAVAATVALGADPAKAVAAVSALTLYFCPCGSMHIDGITGTWPA